MTRVLLVSSYELGEQPLGLAAPAEALLRAGHEVRTADVSVEEWPSADVAWCEAAGFSVPMHTAMRLGLGGFRRLREERPEVPVALYGLYAHVADELGVLRPGDIAASDDVGVALVEFAAGVGALLGHRDPVTDPLAGEGVRSAMLLPLERYARLLGRESEILVGAVDATEGCNHRCRHCPVPVVFDGRSIPVDVDVLLRNVDELVALGAGHIHFGDPDFLNRPQHALRVSEAVHRAHPQLSFDATIKVSHLLRFPDLIGNLAACGLLFVVSAFESTSDVVLERLDKGHRASDLSSAVAILRGAGIEPRPSLLPFTPWTTREEVLDLLDFVVAEDLVPNVDPVQFGIRLLLPPGSLLLENPDPLLEASIVGYDPGTLGYAWRSLDPVLDELAEELARCTEEAAVSQAPIEETYEQVRSRCYRAFGLADPGLPPVTALRGPPPKLRPRLSESWFCCAEPTAAQVGRFGKLNPEPLNSEPLNREPLDPEPVALGLPVRLRRR